MRANYLHYILNSNEEETLYNFFMMQWHNETTGDWTQQIKVDLEDLGIPCDFDFIKSKSSTAFKSLVKRQAKHYASLLLTTKQMKHSKIDDLHYKDFEMQSFFKIPGIQQSKFSIYSNVE